MVRCSTCSAEFDKGEQFCPRDGTPLSAASIANEGVRDPFIGRVLGGRYRLTERLGQGGMGTVYRAVHTLMEKAVAVKILRGELATDAEAVARFHREARSASRLDHDHCIRVTDFGQTDDKLLYLAMELLEGRSLTQFIRQRRPTVTEAATFAHAIALALEHAHEAGVVHRDLKPDNVFLAQRPRGREVVKVLDFGLAKLASDSGQSRSITRDGTVFGTPEYMAPEQAQGEPVDARTDVYSLGVVLYEMLTGELRFRGDTFVAVLTKHVREKPRRPSDLEPTIPGPLEDLVLRCMAKRPDERYPTATAVAEALAPYATRQDATGPIALRDAASPPTGGPAVPPSESPTKRERPAALSSSEERDSMRGRLDSKGQLDSAAEVLLGRPRRVRNAAFVALGVASVAAALFVGRAVRDPAPPRTAAAMGSAPTGLTPELDSIRRLADRGQLDEAAAQLEALHRRGETAALERATSEVAERRGRRLEALAHLHRAKTLAPADPQVRAALAGLLLRLGQKADACHQGRRALELANAARDGATIALLGDILKRAECSPP